jgi:hypothetical protein
MKILMATTIQRPLRCLFDVTGNSAAAVGGAEQPLKEDLQ